MGFAMRKDINTAAAAIIFLAVQFVCTPFMGSAQSARAADVSTTVGLVDYDHVVKTWDACSSAAKLAKDAEARKAVNEINNLENQLTNAIHEAISAQARARNLAVVFDKAAVYSGGQDITNEVLNRLSIIQLRPDGLRSESKSSATLEKDECWSKNPGMMWIMPGVDPGILKVAAVIDRDKVVTRYPRAQELAATLKKEEERIHSLISRYNADYEAAKAKLSAEELQKMQAALQANIDENVRKVQIMTQDMEASLQSVLTAAIRSVAQTHGCDIVLSKATNIPGTDITDDTIARLINPSIASTSQPSTTAPVRSTSQTQSTSATPATPASADSNRPVKDKWALVVGISKFQRPEYNLKYAAKDATDFYNYLINEGNFKKDHVLLLLNEQATRVNIMNAFGDQFLPAVSEDGDLVVIFVSTHGTPAAKDKGGRNYIVAHDTVIDQLYSTGVDMDELSNRIKEGVKTNRALIVMDTCFSGAGIPGAKALNAYDNFDASKVAQGCGRLVITSSSPNERSWESQVSQNGIFTKYLLQSLRENSGRVDLKSAFEKTRNKVQWEVKSAFGQTQTPQLGGAWEGNALILSAPATQTREIFNPALSELIRKNALLTGRDAAAPAPAKAQQAPR